MCLLEYRDIKSTGQVPTTGGYSEGTLGFYVLYESWLGHSAGIYSRDPRRPLVVSSSYLGTPPPLPEDGLGGPPKYHQ